VSNLSGQQEESFGIQRRMVGGMDPHYRLKARIGRHKVDRIEALPSAIPSFFTRARTFD
jgi:hypothetical protein